MSRIDRILDKVEVALDYGSRVCDKIEKTAEPATKVISPYIDSFATELEPILNRPVDWILFVFFTIHIPITLFVDLVAIYPTDLVPSILKQLNATYILLLNDPFMNTTTPSLYWFKSFIFCEAFLQLPFFFFAAYGVLKDKNWVRLPVAVYSAHVMTTVIPLLVELFFNQEGHELSNFQRNCLLGLYAPFFLIPLLGLVDSFIRIQGKLASLDTQLNAKKEN